MAAVHRPHHCLTSICLGSHIHVAGVNGLCAPLFSTTPGATTAQVFRFYFRCNTCAAEMTMKTDPEHADYTVEQGASRNYEPWRDKDRRGAAQPIPSKPYNSETSNPIP